MQIYVIQSGDSLWQIARRFETTVEALRQLNYFSDPNHLVVGQAILIPPAAVEPLRYTVVLGDTLYLLAQLFSIPIATLAQANDLGDSSEISAGMSLIIPEWHQISYRIRPGDTLYQLAAQYGVTVDLIVQVNQIATPELIYPGQTVLIPQPFLPVIKPDIQSLAYFQLSNLSGLERTLTQISPYITYGALFEYAVRPDGSLSVSDNTAAAANLLKRFQISPLITITNLPPNANFDADLARTVLSDEPIRQQLIANIINLLDQFELTGVNIDFENLYPADRPLYTGFIWELTAALNSRGYLSTIAIPAKSADQPDNRWSGAFDYAALGAAANLVFIMTYDWGWSGGPPMAVAPLDKLIEVIAYATDLIPAGKLIQGIPLYGYNWPLPDTPESRASTVRLTTVYDLAFKNNAAINFDSVAQSPWFQYTDSNGNHHEVWFEDVRSVLAKYELARDYNLSGVGFWSPTNEPYGFPQNWAALTEVFNIVK